MMKEGKCSECDELIIIDFRCVQCDYQICFHCALSRKGCRNCNMCLEVVRHYKIYNPKSLAAQVKAVSANKVLVPLFAPVQQAGNIRCGLCGGSVDGIRLLAGELIFCEVCAKNKQKEIRYMLTHPVKEDGWCEVCGAGTIESGVYRCKKHLLKGDSQ
jgi:hypothetical protein